MLVKWDPFKELEQTLRWWGTEPFRRPVWDAPQETARDWTPAVNVYEDNGNLYLDAELPGIDLKQVSISVTNHTLQLRGERKAEREQKKNGCHVMEGQYGTFSRSFSLPSYVNPDGATASYENGVLKITVPKQEKAKPRVIPIKSE